MRPYALTEIPMRLVSAIVRMYIRPLALFALAVAVPFCACRGGAPLVNDGTFDLSDGRPSAEYSDVRSGRFTLHTEDLTWNRCGRLEITGESKDSKGRACHKACVRIGGGAKAPGFQIEPDSMYDFSLEVKGDVPAVHIRALEFAAGEDGGACGKAPSIIPSSVVHVKPSSGWNRVSGRFRTSAKALRVQLQVDLWGRSELKAGDFVLIDNIKVEKSPLMEKLLSAGRRLSVAVVPPVAQMACPFLPPEVADPPDSVSFRAAVNELKPMPVAVANLTDAVAQYRVVLETEPGPGPLGGRILEDGDFGLAGFPPEKIKVREALRFKESDQDPVTLRLDPLPSANGACTITVPPREAGIVWFDFDTAGVRPGVYRGRLRVIPLGEGARYEYSSGEKRLVRRKSSEVFLPVSFTVDPIVLPQAPVRPAHFCAEAGSREMYGLMADVGAVWFPVNTFFFRPEFEGREGNMVEECVKAHRRWAAERGLEARFLVKYAALSTSQRMFNPANDPALKWKVYADMVRLVKRMMNAAGVDEREYLLNTLDEPFVKDIPDLVEAHRIAREVAPDMKLYLTLGVRDGLTGHEFLDALGDSTDMWVFMDSPLFFTGAFLDRIAALRAGGRKVLHYLCSTSPSNDLSLYYRRHCWRGEHFGLDGDFLYIFMDSCAVGRGSLSFKTKTEGGICYKIATGCIPSIRYMAYREGFTDVKYLAALRSVAGDDPEVKEFLETAARKVVVDDPMSRDLPERMRERARELILKHQRKEQQT